MRVSSLEVITCNLGDLGGYGDSIWIAFVKP